MKFTANSPLTDSINSDGNVGVADIGLATRILPDELTPTSALLIKGDVAPYSATVSRPDNEITISDLILIARITLDTFLP